VVPVCPSREGSKEPSSIRSDITPRVQPGNKTKKMSTEPKFDIVPVARKTQQIASALWQQRPVRYLIVPGLVIALGVGALAHLRTKPTNMERPSSPESH
jgi:hypothetical protein